MKAEEAEQIGIGLIQLPLSERFIAKSEASGDNRVFTAADVLGERIVRVASLMVVAARDPELVMVNARPDQQLDALAQFARMALLAPAYLWTENVRHAMAGIYGPTPELPRHVISPKLLPAPSMWWTFETGITIASRKVHGSEAVIDALMIRDLVDAFELYIVGEITSDDTIPIAVRVGRESLPFVQCHRIKYGSTYPDEFTDDPVLSHLQTVLMFSAFLNSPYIPKTTKRLFRAERRENKRRNAPDFGEEITFITLRSPEPRRHEPREGDTAAVDWKHRWIVRGHYRAQWYPGEAAHHVIWIAPYMKGPEDAPLIEHAYRVAR